MFSVRRATRKSTSVDPVIVTYDLLTPNTLAWTDRPMLTIPKTLHIIVAGLIKSVARGASIVREGALYFSIFKSLYIRNNDAGQLQTVISSPTNSKVQ